VTEAQVRALEKVLLDSTEAAGLELHGRVQAAVLVPVFVRHATLHTVLTLRHDELRHHPGQISFPGGRRDPGDPDLIHTALREADEEIGLDPIGVELLGALQPASTFVTDFAVYPFVGLIAPDQTFTAAPQEVEAVLELPVAALAASQSRRTLERNGRSFRTDCYCLDGHLIWGATARILADLLDRLARIPPAAVGLTPAPADRRSTAPSADSAPCSGARSGKTP
jgi:8-oxo-dGTP pyrophosphatase MutT (NUDIX family)